MLLLGRVEAVYRPGQAPGWRPPVVRCSAATGENVAAVVDAIREHGRALDRSGAARARRLRSAEQRLGEALATAYVDELRRRAPGAWRSALEAMADGVVGTGEAMRSVRQAAGFEPAPRS
jgi:putative protein kinase ArgK-like GTPase of G3E family